MIGATVRAIILADAPTLALVSTRVYPLVFPANPTLPCITYRVIAGYNENVATEQVNTTRVQLDVWAETYESGMNVKTELMRLFNFYDGTANGQRIIQSTVDLTFDTFEDNAKKYRNVIDLRIIHEGS